MLTLLISAGGAGCNFPAAFEKGAADVESKSYGANLDQFCLGATDEERAQFQKWYEIGREKGPELRKYGVTQIPGSIVEADGLLSNAQIQSKLDDIAKNTGIIQRNSGLQLQLLQQLREQHNRLAYDSRLSQQQQIRLRSEIDSLQQKLNSVQ